MTSTATFRRLLSPFSRIVVQARTPCAMYVPSLSCLACRTLLAAVFAVLDSLGMMACVLESNLTAAYLQGQHGAQRSGNCPCFGVQVTMATSADKQAWPEL